MGHSDLIGHLRRGQRDRDLALNPIQARANDLVTAAIKAFGHHVPTEDHHVKGLRTHVAENHAHRVVVAVGHRHFVTMTLEDEALKMEHIVVGVAVAFQHQAAAGPHAELALAAKNQIVAATIVGFGPHPVGVGRGPFVVAVFADPRGLAGKVVVITVEAVFEGRLEALAGSHQGQRQRQR